MEQNNLIVTPDGKSWDEVTRDTSYIGNVVSSCRYTAGDVSGGYVVWDDWRGTLNQAPLYNKKQVAIGYDRVIILEDGFYHISLFGCGSSDNASLQIRLRLNGNTSNVAMVHAEGHDDSLRVAGNIEYKAHLIRGDYLQVYGNNWEGYDPYLNIFQISKLN